MVRWAKEARNTLKISPTRNSINLVKRIPQHNDSKWGARYTKIRRPVNLKYSEEFKTLKIEDRLESIEK